VTGSPASIFHASNEVIFPSLDSKHISNSHFFPHEANTITVARPTFPRPIPCCRTLSGDISTPPLTPDDDGSDFGSLGTPPSIRDKQPKDALDLLMALFPHQGLQALPYAKSVAISAPSMGAAFEGVVLELPGNPKTLYVDGKSAESVNLRER
jgi:hypothetical protein